MINFKKIIFILLIISSALATKNSFSASKFFRALGKLCESGKLGKRGKPGDDAPAGIAAPKPNVLALPTTEKELVDLDLLAISDKGLGPIYLNPFTHEEEKKAARRAAKAEWLTKKTPDELAEYKRIQVENQAKNRAKRTPDERDALRIKESAAKAARLADRLKKMPPDERAAFREKQAAQQRAYRARKKDKEAKEAAV